MKTNFCAALILAVALIAARADEKIAVLAAGDLTYTNVTVTRVTATDVFFTYSGGMANVKLKQVSPELQQHFGYDPKAAGAVEQKQAESQAQYHDQLNRQLAVNPPDTAREAVATAAKVPETLWRNDLPGALQQARSDGKRVLLDFTGSDWCPWCIKFDHEVLSTEKFAAYAGQNLELVKVDFPRHTPQSDEIKQANAALAQQFGVDGYPTYVLLDANGRELGRQVGYREGGPAAFISELDGFSRR